MVELLEPGTEAETCLMAGRGMNGLRGVIVCFNPNNQRYTLELAKGDMMSLKIRNVRAVKPHRDEDGEEGGVLAGNATGKNNATSPYAKGQEVFYLSADGVATATIVEAHRDAGSDPYYTIQLVDGREKQTDGKHLTPVPIREGGEETHGVSGAVHEGKGGGSSLPSSPPAPRVEEDDEDRDASGVGENLGISPVTAVLAAAASYFYLKSRPNNDGSNVRNRNPFSGYYPNSHGYGHKNVPEVSVPLMITFAVFAFLAWEWGTKPGRRPRGDFRLSNLSLRLSRCDVWEVTGLLALLLWSLEVDVYHIVSLGVLTYFAWKFGTRDGRDRFGWGNVKTRLANLNVWEALMVANVVQNGLGALNQVARHRRR